MMEGSKVKFVSIAGAAILFFALTSAFSLVARTAAAESDSQLWPAGFYLLTPVQLPAPETSIAGLPARFTRRTLPRSSSVGAPLRRI